MIISRKFETEFKIIFLENTYLLFCSSGRNRWCCWECSLTRWGSYWNWPWRWPTWKEKKIWAIIHDLLSEKIYPNVWMRRPPSCSNTLAFVSIPRRIRYPNKIVPFGYRDPSRYRDLSGYRDTLGYQDPPLFGCRDPSVKEIMIWMSIKFDNRNIIK